MFQNVGKVKQQIKISYMIKVSPTLSRTKTTEYCMRREASDGEMRAKIAKISSSVGDPFIPSNLITIVTNGIPVVCFTSSMTKFTFGGSPLYLKT